MREKKVGRREREREKKKEGEKVRETVKYWPQVSIRDREGPIVTFLQICSRFKRKEEKGRKEESVTNSK